MYTHIHTHTLLNDDANTYREKPILKSQCPSIFTIESRYMENFSESFFSLPIALPVMTPM